MRFAPALLLVLAFQGGRGAEEVQEPGPDILPPAAERALERLADDLARAGVAGEARQCLRLLTSLGGGTEKSRLAARVEAAAGRRPARARLPRLIRDCRRAAELLAAAARRAEGAARERLARAALAVDWETAAAHRLLGHEEGSDGAWRDPAEARLAARRRAIQEILTDLATRTFDVRPVEALDPTLQAIAPDRARAVEYEWLRLEGPLPEADLAGMLQQALRALAFSHWLLDGRLDPEVHEGQVVVLPEREQYLAFLQAAVDAGRISRADADRWREAHGATLESRAAGSRLHVGFVTWTTPRRLPAEILLLFDAAFPVWQPFREDPPVPPWFLAGHVHLVGELVAGSGLGVWYRGGTGVDRRGGRNRLLRCGLRGGQAWLRKQVLEGADPPLAACQLDWFGSYRDESLIKVASVVQYLHETEQAADFLACYVRLTRERQPAGGGATRRAEMALGRSLPEVDAAWREWLLGRGRRSVAGRLAELLAAEPDGAAARFLAELNRLRRQTGVPEVEWEPALAPGVQAHARYIAALPREEQEASFAGREDPRRPGWSLAGAEAAPHCLAARGEIPEVLAAWLRTVQPRAALLHPGLLAVAAARVDDLWVVDVGSLVERGGRGLLLWPVDGAEDLPRSKAREWPEPVPWPQGAPAPGLPVTLVVGAARWGEPVELRLFRDHGGGEEAVPCFVVTPWSASRPGLAPEGLYALVPREPLDPEARYRVRGRVGGEPVEAVFRTRR